MTVDELQIQVNAQAQTASGSLDQLTASLQRLQGATRNTGLDRTSQQLRSISKPPSLSKMERELRKIQAQAERDGDSLVALQRRLEELQQYRGLGNPLTRAGTEEMIRGVEEEIRRLSSAVDEADVRIRTLRQNIQASNSGSNDTLADASRQIRNASANLDSVSRSAQNVRQNLDSASRGADNLGESIRRASSNGSSGMSYLARSIKGMATSFVLFGLMFSASQAISDSLARMAQENEGVNQTLSEIKSSLQYVSDALASVIYPIIKAIGPALVVILDGLASILNVLAMVIAFLTGQDSVIQAQKQWVDYADSVDGAADSMGDATAAAKKLYRALLPIDELNILEDNSSGGTGGSLGPLRFEETSIDPIQLPEFIASPEWTPNPIPAPVFEPVTIPVWAKAPLKSPSWQPNPVPAPAFETLQLPDILLNPLPVPEWAENPIMAPSLSLVPVLQGLAQMAEGFATTWESIKITSTDGATSARAIFAQFVVDTATALQTWGENLKSNFGSVMNYLQTVTVPALSNAASSFAQFVQNTAANVKAWGENVAANVQATLAYIPQAVSFGLSAAAQSVATWVNGTSSNFAAWAKNLIQNAGSAAEGLVRNIVSGLSEAWESFKGAMKAMGEAVSGWWNANKNWAAPLATGVAIAGLTVGAVVLSGGSAAAALPALAALANGGVLTEPTATLVGEYPGAKRNPEIVTPQNIMYDTFQDAQDNSDVVNAIMAGVRQIVRAIEENGGDIYVNGDMTAQQNRKNKMYGKTLQYI